MAQHDDLATALRTLAGGKATVNLNVRIRSGDGVPATGRGGGRAFTPAARSAFTALRGRGDDVLRWLEADPGRAAAFLADPASTLRGSGLGLPEQALRTLATAGEGMTLPGHVKLGTVTARVERGTP